MNNYQPFLMERYMSLFEQDVDYNLSESGVHPITLAELLGQMADRAQQGEIIDIDEVVRTHPDLADELRELWGAVMMADAAVVQFHPISEKRIRNAVIINDATK